PRRNNFTGAGLVWVAESTPVHAWPSGSPEKEPLMRSVFVSLLFWTVLSQGPSEASAAEATPGRWPRADGVDSQSVGIVRRALDGASRQLADDRCRAIFKDFTDQ